MEGRAWPSWNGMLVIQESWFTSTGNHVFYTVRLHDDSLSLTCERQRHHFDLIYKVRAKSCINTLVLLEHTALWLIYILPFLILYKWFCFKSDLLPILWTICFSFAFSRIICMEIDWHVAVKFVIQVCRLNFLSKQIQIKYIHGIS